MTNTSVVRTKAFARG